MGRVSITRYDSLFSEGLAGMVADEAKGRKDLLSRNRRALAFSDDRKGTFSDLLAAAKPQTFGYAWQNIDLDIWAAAGHEAENFGSAPKVDGMLCGVQVQYKASRLNVNDRFQLNDLPSPRSKVVNLALFADGAAKMCDWPVFVGTTSELKRSAALLRSLNAGRTATVTQGSNGTWNFSASASELARFGGELPGFMLLRDYVLMRNDCGFCR